MRTYIHSQVNEHFKTWNNFEICSNEFLNFEFLCSHLKLDNDLKN